MPSCAFRKCSNNTRNTNKAKGVTFHTFPQDLRYKEKWIEVIQEDQRDEGWLPTRYSRVCSSHFKERDFHLTPLGRRKININAIPVLHPTLDLTEDFSTDREETIPGSPLKNADVSDTDSIFEMPLKIYLQELNTEKSKTEKCRREILKVNKQKNKLKSKNHSLREIVKYLKKKKYFKKENFNEIAQIAQQANKDFVLANVKKRRTISPTLRKFYATLHHYSPTAYKCIRSKFNNVLPHPRIIGKWYDKSDASPGFTQQVFERLRKKSKQTPIIATLIVDEMAIRQRTTWNGRQTVGLVDEGLGPKDEVATQVYVFLLVSNTENWKIPLGYFFINGLRAEQRANLIQICISKCYNVNVNIIALTFHACSANVAAAEILGCNFQNIDSLKTTFPHPSCANKKVAVLFDAWHMLKLVRDTFESKKILFSDAGRVEWLYLYRLYKLQKKIGFNFANKVTKRHIAFRNQIMKVNLASQVISRSVSNALTLCSDMLTGRSFGNVDATIEFIEMFNDLFDIFNSTTYKQGFKRPFSAENELEIIHCLDIAEKYIKGLKINNKVKRTTGRRITITKSKKDITKAKCRMGFLGFLIDIQSLKHIYAEEVKKYKTINYLSTYRFSQDHIQLSFGLMRQHGGHNNPTTEQFRDIYKKVLCRLELPSSFIGNYLPIDNCSMLSCSSALEELNMTSSGFRDLNTDLMGKTLSTEDKQCEINSEILSRLLDDVKDISEISIQIIGYIAGWVVRKVVKTIKCQICCNSLMSDRKLAFHKLITLKNLGGLFLPSQDVFDICVKTESFLRLHKKLQRNAYVHSENEYKAYQIKILKLFIQSNTFDILNDHSLEQPATRNHKILLIKSAIEFYADIRLNYIHQNAIITNREKCNKLVLF